MAQIRRLFNNLFRSLASKGRGLAVCDCDIHPIWDPNQLLYKTDDVVVHEKNIYIAASSEGCEADDIPGESVHWIHVCSCPEIIIPTPTPTPTIDLQPTPTPTRSDFCPIITEPTEDICVCSNYPVWAGIKYDSFTMVSWNGSVWEAYEWEGTDANDEPGKSIHWKHICDCITTPTPTFVNTPTPTKIVCCDDSSAKYEVGSEKDTFIDTDVGITINKFIYQGEICIPTPTLDYCNDLITPVTIISPNNKNIGTIIFYGGVNSESDIYLNITDSSFAEKNGYKNYDNKCLHGKILDGKCKLEKI